MKTSTTGYVTIQITDQSKQPVLGLVTVLGVFSGQTRLSESGVTEALFMVISPRSNCETIWVTQDMCITNTPTDKEVL